MTTPDLSEMNAANADELLKHFYFGDGLRETDFVLWWDGSKECNATDAAVQKRNILEKQLEAENFELERYSSCDVHYIKVHTPVHLLKRTAQIMKLQLPVKRVDQITFWDYINYYAASYFWFHLSLYPHNPQKCLKTYTTENDSLFEEESFLQLSTRSQIVDFIFKHRQFRIPGTNDSAAGIEGILKDGLYSNASRVGSNQQTCHKGGLATKIWQALRGNISQSATCVEFSFSIKLPYSEFLLILAILLLIQKSI